MKIIEPVGKRFGRLVIIEEAGENKHREVLWLCRCDCGNIIKAIGVNLRKGSAKSCGCLQKEAVGITGNNNKKHGMTGTKTFAIWQAMVQRCTNSNSKGYKYYGKRGITVNKKWFKFEGFLEDMGEKPEGLTLDRKNNEKGYYKENCRWVSMFVQSHNKRVQKRSVTGITGVTVDKETQKYKAYIRVRGKAFHLGYFVDLQDAKIARKEAELKHWKT